MLSSLPVFFMFFYEAPKKVINEITLFQSRFLWHDTEEKKGIHWIKWSKVCKSKDEGGLGVKNFEFFNEALLLKWKWRFTQDDNIIWRDLLTERYENLQHQVLKGGILEVLTTPQFGGNISI